MNGMTERQVKALAKRIEEAKLHGAEISAYQPWSDNWHIRFADEVRPGRGQDLSAVWVDGDHVVVISLDVYGGGRMDVAEANFIHSGEECQCDICLAEMDDERG